MRKEHRLRLFENNVLRRIFESKMEGVTEACRNCVMRNFIIHAPKL
jgi:hypothetical protein